MEDLIKAWGQTARTASATIRVNSVEDAIQGLLEAALADAGIDGEIWYAKGGFHIKCETEDYDRMNPGAPTRSVTWTIVVGMQSHSLSGFHGGRAFHKMAWKWEWSIPQWAAAFKAIEARVPLQGDSHGDTPSLHDVQKYER